MQNKSNFILSGIVSFSFYILICFLAFQYVIQPKAKTYTIKSKATVIELDMIVLKSDKKRVEKKEDKKAVKPIEKVVEKSTSAQSKQRPDLKSLFGKVKTTETKVAKKEVNNVVKSLDPKRFKAKFEKQKKSTNVTVDKLLNDVKTTTNITSSNLSKSSESDDYYSKINSLLSIWTPTVREEGLHATVLVTITKSGVFDYRFIKYSQNSNFNISLKAFLEEQKSIIYPIPKKGNKVTINVDYKSEG